MITEWARPVTAYVRRGGEWRRVKVQSVEVLATPALRLQTIDDGVWLIEAKAVRSDDRTLRRIASRVAERAAEATASGLVRSLVQAAREMAKRGEE